MAFFLFILVNAALFIRPAEIVPALLGWEIYFYVILACLVAAVPDVVTYLVGQRLGGQPITLCVLGLLVTILIPAALTGELEEVSRAGSIFGKVIVYYLLFVSLVTTPERLRIFLSCILSFTGLITALGVLRYHDLIELYTIQALTDSMEGRYGTAIAIRRLQGTGVFQDPNELCVLLSTMIPLALYFVLSSKSLAARLLAGSLLPLFGYAVLLTSSRGGFLAFAGGLGVLVWMRYGWKKAAFIGAIGAPLVLLAFAGRQTDISTSSGTGRARIEKWREWLTEVKEHLPFGKGISVPKEDDKRERRSDQEFKHLAHNSYLQSFADLGLLGGILFVGAFFLALWGVHRYGSDQSVLAKADMQEIQPHIFAAVSAYALGMVSLSICYVVPTFFVLALAVSYMRIARNEELLAPPALCFDYRLAGQITAVSIGVLGSIYVFVRFLA